MPSYAIRDVAAFKRTLHERARGREQGPFTWSEIAHVAKKSESHVKNLLAGRARCSREVAVLILGHLGQPALKVDEVFTADRPMPNSMPAGASSMRA